MRVLGCCGTLCMAIGAGHFCSRSHTGGRVRPLNPAMSRSVSSMELHFSAWTHLRERAQRQLAEAPARQRTQRGGCDEGADPGARCDAGGGEATTAEHATRAWDVRRKGHTQNSIGTEHHAIPGQARNDNAEAGMTSNKKKVRCEMSFVKCEIALTSHPTPPHSHITLR